MTADQFLGPALVATAALALANVIAAIFPERTRLRAVLKYALLAVGTGTLACLVAVAFGLGFV